MPQRFEYVFEELKHNHITFDYAPDEDEVLEVVAENGNPILYLNRSGLLTLAKLLVKMSLGPYTNGFHIHLNGNFNADEPESLTAMLTDTKSVDPARQGLG
jgi:hypothetical protein